MKHFYSQIKKFINIALFLGIFLQSYISNSQTTLAAGDIIFTGYDSNPAPAAGDAYSFVLLTNISAGTTISFTDRGYFAAGAWQPFGGTESTVTWTSGTAIPLGTEILIKGLTASTYNTATSSLVTNGTVTLKEGTPANGLSLSTVGDQVIAFQGGTGIPESAVTFISGIHYFYCSAGATTSQASWDDVACADGPNSSVLPVGLTGGVSSFYVGTLAGNIVATSARFSGSGPFANAAAIRSAVMNQANWTLSNTTPAVAVPSGTPFLGVAPTITGNPPNRTLCPGFNTTFPATATDATGYQWQVNTGSGFTNLSNVAPYSNVTTSTLTVTGATAAMSGYTYRVVVTGAGSATSNPATLTVPDMTVTTTSQSNISCKGLTNGAATLSVSGGIPPYTYLWSPSGVAGATASGLGAGTYTVTVTDNILCSKTHTVTITEPAAALNGTPSVTNVSCFGGSNGTATITPSGGTPGYTYLWSNGATTATASGLIAGTYSVTITDANSCTSTISNIIVGGPASIVNATASTTAVSCFGGSNGTATIVASGGTPSYTYLWSNGATTATATGLLAGTYSVVFTDANSCTRTVNNIVVGGPVSIISATPFVTNVSCNGGSNGTATIVASGGTPGYTYLWSNGATTATASGLLAGTYSVTITDANSCTRTVTNIIVGQPAVLNGTPGVTNVSCNGGSNGTATITPTGGVGGYTYLWSNGATTQTITGLQTGNYSVTISDSNGCSRTINNIAVTEPSVLTASQGPINNVSCNGGSNGTATVLVTGGTSSYTYSWSPSGGTAATASGLSQGTYTVTVTDANSCQTTQSFTITEPAAFSVTTSQTDILCNGAATGSATVNVTGGTGAYTYSWSPSGGTAATATGLTAGTYTVTITDANTCQTTRSFTITQPIALTVLPVSQTNIGCRGEATGSATVNATGGTGAYTYSWSPTGGTAATATGLTAGTYTVTVTDANLCQKTQSFTITQPAAILSASTASTGVSCFGGSNGSASVTVTGGTPGYTFSWSPLGGTTASISGRPAGNYTATITDANGCTLVKNITISTPSQLSVTTSKTDVSCNGGSNGTATVTATGGTSGYTYSWSPFGGNAATATGLQAGTYTVTVTDANSCQATQTVTLIEPTPLAVTPSQTNVLCNGGATGTASVVVSGGNGGYSYVWSPAGGTSATATGLTAGNYSVLITDVAGCSYTQNFTINQPSILVASTSQINATCVVGGQAAVTPSGGTTPYTYLWSNGETTQVVTNLAAGLYSIDITDDNGCTITKNFTISTINTLVATTSQTNVLCNGSNTGTATVVSSGAPGPFTYVWSPSGGTAATATGLTAGNYSVTITSDNGCSIVKNFAITEPTAIVVTPSQTNVSCNAGANGSASVAVTGGTGAYSYLWTPGGGTAATATGLATGTYSVTITDANLCATTQSFTISEPDALTFTTVQTNVSCNGGSNGSATVSVTGGTGAYTYLWSPTGGTAATASGLSVGTYTVTITDANACQATAIVTITEPNALSATISQVNVSCNGQSDGSATVNVTGGTGTYTYAWSPAGGTAATATDLTAGSYSVTITDANSCTITENVIITVISDVTAPLPDVTNLPDITNYCAVLATQIPIPTATDNCSGIITATTTDPLSYPIVGNYIITWFYIDASGNTATQQQNINVLASPLDEVTFSDAEFTFNGSLQTISVANLPAGASVAYTTTPSTGTANGAVNAGFYTVTATISPAASAPNCAPIMLTAQLEIKKAAQQITFEPLAERILGINNDFNLEAVSNSGLPVRYSFTYASALPAATVSASGFVNLLRSGQLEITAHQDGDANYLAAADVSQILVIKNNDVTVTSITIGGEVFNNPAKDITYLLECGENNPNISILNNTNATITPSANFIVQTPKPGIYTQNVGITSQDGSTTANYIIRVEKPFGFYDIVKQKFNNVLLVNNNPQTNGGYEFVAYQWFKNGQLIGTGQYYTAGDDVSNVLDPNAVYSVKMTTKDGSVLQTCESVITIQNSLTAKLYPNPVEIGKTLTVEADFPAEDLQNMQISLYTVSGKLIKTVQSSSVITEIQLPQATESNMYLVVLESGSIKKSFKVIVK